MPHYRRHPADLHRCQLGVVTTWLRGAGERADDLTRRTGVTPDRRLSTAWAAVVEAGITEGEAWPAPLALEDATRWLDDMQGGLELPETQDTLAGRLAARWGWSRTNARKLLDDVGRRRTPCP